MIPRPVEDFETHWHRADQRDARLRNIRWALYALWFGTGLIGTSLIIYGGVALYAAGTAAP